MIKLTADDSFLVQNNSVNTDMHIKVYYIQNFTKSLWGKKNRSHGKVFISHITQNGNHLLKLSLFRYLSLHI